MAPVVHVNLLSPCARAVALVIRKVGLESEFTLNNISMVNQEHMAPEFVKKFPMHAVPALEDDGFYLWDSHAIVAYIINAYAKDDSLYPKDAKKRAKVDQWLHYSNQVLYNKLRDMSMPLWTKQRTDLPEEKKEAAKQALKDMETMLGDKKFLCGEDITIADIACVCEYVSMEAFLFDLSGFPTLNAWADRCEAALPGYKEVNIEPNEQYKAIIKSMLT